jgi:hypothetical protein
MSPRAEYWEVKIHTTSLKKITTHIIQLENKKVVE